MINVKEFQVGPLRANCFVVTNGSSDAVIIDAGGTDRVFMNYLEENKIIVRAILLTHGHFDHIFGAKELKEKFGAEIYIHDYDYELTSSTEKSLAYWVDEEFFTPFSADKTFLSDDIISVAGMDFKVMHCPGHTRGSSCFIINDNIFTGDALFCGSIGRSDVYGSDPVIQKAALKQFCELSGDYNLYCGHGEKTKLSVEMKTNPYLLDFRK